MNDGMNDKNATLTLENYLEIIRHAEESQLALAELKHETLQDLKGTSLHAVHLVRTLYSELSSDAPTLTALP
jgi:hypothetical protein